MYRVTTNAVPVNMLAIADDRIGKTACPPALSCTYFNFSRQFHGLKTLALRWPRDESGNKIKMQPTFLLVC